MKKYNHDEAWNELIESWEGQGSLIWLYVSIGFFVLGIVLFVLSKLLKVI